MRPVQGPVASWRAALLAVCCLAIALLPVDAKRLFRRPRPNVVFQFRDIYPCPEHPEQNASVALRYSESGDVYADSSWDVVYPAQRISKLRQILTSCRADGTACEHFMTWNSPMDGCAFVAAKHAVWSPAFDNIRPPFVCPVQAVRYTNKNWTVDKDLLLALPFPRNRLYKDRMEMLNEREEMTFCFVLEMIWLNVGRRGGGGGGSDDAGKETHVNGTATPTTTTAITTSTTSTTTTSPSSAAEQGDSVDADHHHRHGREEEPSTEQSPD